ncbi:hypothetical protein L9G74_06830 [Shewanella sp. C32]|uniref:Uncharacterized protein n=1 Tax=Shewanella electrica TaxID=515560 RepID=A0ABT2FIJ6_9GAMM|nr:hypothetical protein [Shewanella electrica]MCH1924244.1 hypothetical protein [Shewanella electrica]MCS4556147.1 hypothetical protein [Shewanella electrica]
MRGNPQGIVVLLCSLVASYVAAAEAPEMTPADWRTVTNGIMEDDGNGYYMDIYQKEGFAFFGLRYGKESNQLNGFSMGDRWTIDSMPVGEKIPTQCWNEQSKKWVDQSHGLDEHHRIEHNTIHTYYTGTNVPIKLKVTPFDTQSAAWQQQLKKFPQGLKFQQVKWPAHVFLVGTTQARDVICRETEQAKYPIRGDRRSIEKLNNAIIVNSLFREFYPDRYTGTRGRFTLDDGRHFTWYLQTTTLGEKLLAVLQKPEFETFGMEEPRYYQWTADGWLEEVQWYEHTDDSQPMTQRLTFSSEFAQQLASHLKSIGTAMPAFDQFDSLMDEQTDE